MNLGRRPMQKDLKIRRQRPTVKDTLRYGGMKLIEEVLEAPMKILDDVHVTKMDILLSLVTH